MPLTRASPGIQKPPTRQGCSYVYLGGKHERHTNQLDRKEADMRQRLTISVIVAMGVALVFGGIVLPQESQATQLPSACVAAEVDSQVTSTSIEVDSDGNTCPDPPPTTGTPCPDAAVSERDQRTTAGIHTDVFWCAFI